VPAFLALVALVALPAVASAHPLGNFTINHYAGLTIGRGAVELDVVIDMAEIPAFQERQSMDSDEDGTVSDTEGDAWSATACAGLAKDLHLGLGGTALAPAPDAHGLAFPPGAGGLSTLRLECGYHAPFATMLQGPAALTFSDGSWSERIGWREIVATADGTILETHGLPASSPSAKLTAYPADLIARPLDIRSASIAVRPDPAARVAGSAAPATAAAPAPAAAARGDVARPGQPAVAAPATVPGGVAAELPSIFQSTDLTPFVLLASLASAVALGAWHALTPGHGKTLMAAYLVGTRGTPVHAVGLGLSVATSHTLGIVALALVILGAQGVLPPDVVVRATPVVAAVSILAIGGWMVVGEVRRRRAAGASAATPHAHAHPLEEADRAHGHEHDQAHEHPHELGVEPAAAAGLHSHGGRAHTHLPPADRTLSWRGLFVLGLAGGLIPSTSALIILLGSIAAGRPAFGLVLVIAFGLGMAAVMTGVGLVMVAARGRLDRMPSRSTLGRLATAAPLIASVAVLGLGVVLTWSAVVGAPVL
jgi:nickel/cobalt transporter (NicO) family protein